MHRRLIDCHVLHLPSERQDWADECNRSLALNREDLCIHHLNGIPGQYMKSRRMGFMCGNQPFVSFVDPDDYVTGPGVFEQCLHQITSHISSAVAVWSGSRVWTARDGIRAEPFTPGRPHQLIVCRRDVVEAAITTNPIDDTALWLEVMRHGLMVHVPEVIGYVWRDHPRGHHRVGDAGFACEKSQLPR